MTRNAVDSAMIELAYQDALERINRLVEAIYGSQGWLEELASDDPGNVTVWIGPRLAQIQDEVKAVLA